MTPLLHARKLGDFLGLPHLYLKLESANPTGTHKDRAARKLADAAVAIRAPGLTIGTCGNLGVAAAWACKRLGLRCHVLVPAQYRNTRCDEMIRLGASVDGVEGIYEDAVEASHRFAQRTGWFDANPDGPAGEIAISAYSDLAWEIVEACSNDPKSIWLATGNGTTAAGLFAWFAGRGKPPAICVVGSVGNTALTASLKAGRLIELKAVSCSATPVNEPLVNRRSLHAAQAFAAVSASGGLAHEATDEELLRMQRLLLETEGVRATAAAAGALAGIIGAGTSRIRPEGLHVLILTA